MDGQPDHLDGGGPSSPEPSAPPARHFGAPDGRRAPGGPLVPRFPGLHTVRIPGRDPAYVNSIDLHRASVRGGAGQRPVNVTFERMARRVLSRPTRNGRTTLSRSAGAAG